MLLAAIWPEMRLAGIRPAVQGTQVSLKTPKRFVAEVAESFCADPWQGGPANSELDTLSAEEVQWLRDILAAPESYSRPLLREFAEALLRRITEEVGYAR